MNMYDIWNAHGRYIGTTNAPSASQAVEDAKEAEVIAPMVCLIDDTQKYKPEDEFSRIYG